MLVLGVLRYDICAITPHDFVDLMLSRLPIGCQHVATVRQHTQTFIALCATGLLCYCCVWLDDSSCVMSDRAVRA